MNERLPSPTLSSSHGALSSPRLSECPPAMLRRLGPTIAGYGLPFVLILYLALRNGGYDSIVRSESGSRSGGWCCWGQRWEHCRSLESVAADGIALALLGGFALWTGLGIGWSESSERSVTESARVRDLPGRLRASAQRPGGSRSAPRCLLRRRRNRNRRGPCPPLAPASGVVSRQPGGRRSRRMSQPAQLPASTIGTGSRR